MPSQAAVTLDHLSDDDIFGEGKKPGFDLRFIVAAIRANLVVIIAIIAAALALALVVTLLDTKRYTANASVQINDQSQQVLGDVEATSEQATSSWDTERFLQTQVDVLKSRALALRVIKRLRLEGNARFYEQMEVTAPDADASPAAIREMTIALLQGNMQVRLPRNSRIAVITFESTDPALSAQIANAFAEEFIQASLQQRFDSSSYAREFVGNQLQEAKSKLEQSERDLNTYARSAGLIRTRDAGAPADTAGGAGSGASSITTASLMQLNAEASQAQARRIAAEAKLKSINSKSLLSDRDALQNPAVQNLFTERARVEAKLEDELTRHLDGHPNVRQLRAQLKSIDDQLMLAAQNVRSAARAEYEAALATERQLKAQVDALKAATLNEQDQSVQYNLLAREADTNRALYDGLLQRYKELNASAGISTSNISIIDRADPPMMPSSPNLLKNLAYALLAGLGLAALTTFLRSQFDDTVRVPEDVEHKLELPLLGVIPRARDGDPDAELADPKSPISEGYNSLRGALLYSTSHGLPRSMLVTSSQPSEGKTTSSFAIAQGLARMGRKVLLVDVDLRRPSVHRRLSLDNEQGMTTLLTSQATLDSVIKESGHAGLSVITSGPVPPSPTELIASTRMEELIEELTGRYDVVVFDCPPILGLADAPLMSALVDGVVFVIESERARRGSLKASLRRLRTMRPMLLGAVLTMFDPSKAGHRYSEYYGYEYYTYNPSDGSKG
ncbi:MAG: polysaccharide biosynthesis tyrosine autokinase [Sphingomonadaceae bacterium]|nr:polysaccharide biosynthesis tyrosine autokinase [Sphingomonadaceae bacterium]